MLGKLIDGRLVVAGSIVKDGNTTITNPTQEQLIALGYKEISYTEKPSYDEEEEKLVETYRDGDEIDNNRIYVNYEVVALTTEEHNEVIKRKIVEEENKITERNKLDYMIDKDNEALKRIQQHRSIIVELRAKLREITPKEEE